MKRILSLFALFVLVSASLLAESFTIEVSPSTGTCLRGGSSVVTSGWFSTWTSTDTPTITIQPANGSTTNNMTVATGGLTLAEGSATSFNYSVSAPSGYIITGMSAQLISAEGKPTVNIAGVDYETSTSAQSVKISGLNHRSLTIALTSADNNAKATLTKWTLTVEEGEASKDPSIVYSTEDEVHWYYICSTSTSSYCTGQVWYYDAAADRMKYGTKAFMSDRIWSFWKNSEGKIAIKNYDGVYVGTAGSGTGSSTQFGKSASANYIYDVSYYDENAFLISDGGVELHAQQSGSVIVRWAAGTGNASLWNFVEVDVSEPETRLYNTKVEQGRVTTGIGNANLPILRSTLTVAGLTGETELQGVSGKVVATDAKDVIAVRAYLATDGKELFLDPEGKMPWRTPNGELFGEGTLNDDGTYTVTGSKTFSPGTYYLWIVYDVSADAKEGHTVDATITSYTMDGESWAEKSGNPAYAATIFLSEGSVLMPGDKGTAYYRIPAICASADGKRLVVLTDDRKNHGSDLPSHCYVVAQYSEDLGRTWSEPVNVAGTASTGGDYGHGDASLITDRITGDIIGIMTCSTNGTGFFASTPDKPQTWKTIRSHDGGRTWSKPVDHTKTLYGADSPHPNWYGGFSGSGAGLQRRDGTLVSPFVNREIDADSVITQNFYLFMSKDGGQSWYVSGSSGTTACDEPKVLERNNGDLAISTRSYGYNFTNFTPDDGATWGKAPQTRFTSGISGNACDGDYMVWCSTLDGNAQNIAFQTCPNNSSRRNLSIALSSDEGETFFNVKTICPRGSAYSSAVVLPDGTLGVYYEEESVHDGYHMRFVRFSLDWASDGQYAFTEEQPFRPVQTSIDYKMPSYEWNTIVLPYEAEIPAGVEAYNCTQQTLRFVENETEYTGILLEKVEGTTLAAHTPYVLKGAEGTYHFARPISEWKAHPLPENCTAKNGPLVGCFVNKRLKGDGATIYNNFKNIASRGGVGFNRVTASSMVSIPAYSCYLQLDEANELTLRPLTEIPVGVQGVMEASSSNTRLYHLNGTPRAEGERGIFVKEGATILIQ